MIRGEMSGPGEYTLRLARPQDASAVGDLIALAGVTEPVILEAIEQDICSSVALAALESHDAGVQALAEHAIRDNLNGAMQADTVALVAVHPHHPAPVAAVITSPPGSVMQQIHDQGAGLEPLMMLLMAVAKIPAIATHPEHRQSGLGTALLLQATTLAHQIGRTTVYGTTRTDDNLVGWYQRRGFSLRAPGDGLDLSWLVQRPFGISSPPDEQMFISTQKQPARLTA